MVAALGPLGVAVPLGVVPVLPAVPVLLAHAAKSKVIAKSSEAPIGMSLGNFGITIRSFHVGIVGFPQPSVGAIVIPGQPIAT
jgi:hypothetical protein